MQGSGIIHQNALNFHIYRCEDIQFDKFEFPVNSDRRQSVEGHSLYVNYYLNENAPDTKRVADNKKLYKCCKKKSGGQVIYEYDDGGEYRIQF